MRTQVPINVPAWWLIVMPVLSMFLIGIIILIVINLVNTRQKKVIEKEDQSQNSKTKEKDFKENAFTSWIKKKDLLYWLLIICLGAISLFTFRYKDATEVISHWSFAGTIVSIILAVIAIGFTLFQTLTSELSSEKIAKSAEKIVLASEEIDSTELQKSSNIIKEAAGELLQIQSIIETKFNSLNDELSEIKKGHEESYKVLSALNKVTNFESTGNEEKDRILPLDLFIEKTFPSLNDNIQFAAYINFLGKYKNYDVSTEYGILLEYAKVNQKFKDVEKLDISFIVGVFTTVGHILQFTGTLSEFDKLQNQDEILRMMEDNFSSVEFKELVLKIIK